MKIKFTGILLLTLALSSQAIAQIPTTDTLNKPEIFDLDLHLEPGSVFHFQNTFEQKLSQTFMGARLQGKQNIFNEFEMNVLESTNLGTVINVTFTRIRIENDRNATPVFYDSEALTDGPLGYLEKLIGKSFRITLNQQGLIVKQDSLETLFNTIPQDDQLSAFSYPFVKAILNNALFLFDEQAVELGQTWTNPAQLPVSGDFVLEVFPEYTLESLSEDLVWLNVESNIQDPNGFSGSVAGNYEVDRYTGLISYGTTTFELSRGTGSENTGQDAEIFVKNTIQISKKPN